MSLEATVWALKKAPVDDPIAHLVLIGLADHAASDGTGAWPSVETLAEYARCSPRSVHRKLRDLETAGLIVRGEQGMNAHVRSDRRPTVYDLAISTPVENTLHGVTQSHPVKGDGVTRRAPRGDRPGSHGVTVEADKPSINHPEPAATRAAGERRHVSVENLPDEVQELRAAFAAVDRLSGVSFARLTPVRVDQLVARVRAIGAPAMVRQVRNAHNPPRWVQAFLADWDAPVPLRVVEPAPRCPSCGLTLRTCDAKLTKDPEWCPRGRDREAG